MSRSGLRIAFGGTPDFAAEHLKVLIDEGFDICVVYTQPDRAAGRGKKLTASPVKELALKHGIPVEQPANFKNSEDVEQFRSYKPDLFAVVAYGVLLPESILKIPQKGCINVHGSLLPKYRGAAPIQRAVYDGEVTTGITIMRMDKGLDTGDAILTKQCAISSDDTSGSLFEKLASIGPLALIEAIDSVEAGTASYTPQNHELATYAKKLSKEESPIDFKQPSRVIDCRIRALSPWPLATVSANGTENIKVHVACVGAGRPGAEPGTVLSAGKDGIEIATADGSVILKELQLPGKKRAPAGDIVNGHKDLFIPGEKL